MKINKFLFVLILIVLFALFFGIWTFIHESSHFAVCKLIGGDPFINLNLLSPHVKCSGIAQDQTVIIPEYQYFLFSIIPYILGLLILIILLFVKKEYILLQYFLIIRIGLDNVMNYLPLHRTDFVNIRHFISPEFFILASLVFFLSIFLTIYLFLEKWQYLDKFWTKA